MKEQDDEAEATNQKDQRKNVVACWGRRRDGWTGMGDVYIIEFVCLMIPSREAGTFGSLYTK